MSLKFVNAEKETVIEQNKFKRVDGWCESIL